jgi:hypothetical protein
MAPTNPPNPIINQSGIKCTVSSIPRLYHPLAEEAKGQYILEQAVTVRLLDTSFFHCLFLATMYS